MNGIQICSNEEPRPFLREDNYEIAKIHKRHLKILFSRTTGPISTKLGRDLFVCLEFFVPLEIFSLIWRRHYCRWRPVNFDLCSALMATEQWGFLSVPHLLWHGASVYNEHLLEPVILAYNDKRLAVELSLPVLTTHKVCRSWDSNTQSSACGANALTHYATAVVNWQNLKIFFSRTTGPISTKLGTKLT